MSEDPQAYFQGELEAVTSTLLVTRREMSILVTETRIRSWAFAAQVIVLQLPFLYAAKLLIYGEWESRASAVVAIVTSAAVGAVGIFFLTLSLRTEPVGIEGIGAALDWLEERSQSLADEAINASVEALRRDYTLVAAGNPRGGRG